MSAIHDAENMTADELKAKREEIIKSIIEVEPIADVAARFVDARYDAKRRDELLAEQADTLAALKTGLAAVEERAAADAKEAADEYAAVKQESRKYSEAAAALQQKLAATVEANTEERELLLSESTEVIALRNTAIADLQAALTKATARGNRLHIQADKAHAAYSGALKLLLDAKLGSEVAEAANPDASE